jgi:hypothetical protein
VKCTTLRLSNFVSEISVRPCVGHARRSWYSTLDTFTRQRDNTNRDETRRLHACTLHVVSKQQQKSSTYVAHRNARNSILGHWWAGARHGGPLVKVPKSIPDSESPRGSYHLPRYSAGAAKRSGCKWSCPTRERRQKFLVLVTSRLAAGCDRWTGHKDFWGGALSATWGCCARVCGILFWCRIMSGIWQSRSEFVERGMYRKVGRERARTLSADKHASVVHRVLVT